MTVLKWLLAGSAALVLLAVLAGRLGLVQGRAPGNMGVHDGRLKPPSDTEFWFDRSAGVVQVRSASRLGKRDFGVNRARVEAIRARLHGR